MILAGERRGRNIGSFFFLERVVPFLARRKQSDLKMEGFAPLPFAPFPIPSNRPLREASSWIIRLQRRANLMPRQIRDLVAAAWFRLFYM